MNVRITSGIYRGRPLKTPQTAHPMGSREKLALFNVLSPFLASSSVLDGFCGSGALGFEAASRGARRVVFVDSSPAATKIVRENARTLDFGKTAEFAIFTTPFAKYAKKALSGEISPVEGAVTGKFDPFDLIFLDPPYDRFDPAEFASVAPLLAPGGRLTLSHPKGTAPVIPGLERLSTKTYAGAAISLFQNPESVV